MFRTIPATFQTGFGKAKGTHQTNVSEQTQQQLQKLPQQKHTWGKLCGTKEGASAFNFVGVKAPVAFGASSLETDAVPAAS
jgi:hypothetical protein